MLAAFWSGLGGELSKQWAARVVTPALAFWLGGVAAVWWYAHGAQVRAEGWAGELESSTKALGDLPAVAQGLLVVAALMLVAASGLAAERLTLPLLRLLEGYGPWRLRGAGQSRRRRRRAQLKQRRDTLNLKQHRRGLDRAEYREFRKLQSSPAAHPERLEELTRKRRFSPRQAAELDHARRVVHDTPEDDALAMPTRLGDLLRAAERRPADKYGLDAVICWTALWMVLPPDACSELVQTRTRLDASLRMWLWGAAFIVWTPWTLWAIPIAVIVPLLAYYGGILGAARLFGDLVVTSFDLYKMQLYDSLHLPRPESPADERRRGAQLTNLLWGGLDDASVRYVAPAPTTD